MAILLIIVGLGLLGYYFLGLSSEGPNPPSAKIVFALGGVFSIGASLYSFYMMFNVNGVSSLFFLGLLVGGLIAGVQLFKAASNADSKTAGNVSDRVRTQQAKTEYVKARFDHDNAGVVAADLASLEAQKRRTEKDALEHQSMALDVLNSLAPTAKEMGLDINSVADVNRQHYSNEADLKRLAGEKQIEFAFRVKEKELEAQVEGDRIRQQLEAADRVEHYRLVGELEDQLEELYEKRRRIELDESDEVLRNQKLARLDKRIAQREADIDARENRLLSASDGKEIKRLT